MPTDATILATQGREALRAKWREKERLRRLRLGLRTRESYRACKQCAAPITQRAEGKGSPKRYCSECRPRGAQTHPCELCGGKVNKKDRTRCFKCKTRMKVRPCPCGNTFTPHHSQQRYCSAEHRRFYTVVGRSCRITVAACPACSKPFTSRLGAKWCPNCYSREYQRMTHVTAIRYWRIADTKQAEDLAKVYFKLRQELRTHGHQE